MTEKELWTQFLTKNPHVIQEPDAWQFGANADELAQLVLSGKKTATSSGYELYAIEDEDLPQKGTFDIILDSQNQAVCVIQITNVSIIPFNQVTSEQAFKEGEGDRSLAYWKQVHQDFFKPYYEEVGLVFSGDSLIVFEEFQVVYAP